MKNIKLNKKNYIIIILILLEFSLLLTAGLSYGNKNLDKYIIGKSTSDSSLFAIMLEDSTGEYKQSSTSTFPGYEYFYNQSKSGCMNNSGKQIKDSLLYDQDNKKATVNVSETSMCYLYFDKYKSTSFSDELIASNTLWQSNLEGDGYRFTGSGTATDSTSPKNFICFGTADKSTCTSNPSTYMYRIIGVFADENGDNHVKLIKYTQLPTAYQWHSDNTVDVDWADSDLYKGLNGSYFLTNTTYSYMQDNTWLDMISNWKWTAVNTKSYEDQTNNPYYYYTTGKGIYLHEMNNGTSSDTSCTNYNGTAINCLGGSWTTPTAKIGLMYASDYALSLGQAALSYTSSSNKATLLTGWMHQSNNEITVNTWEWTISRVGANGSTFRAWYVTSAGSVSNNNVTYSIGASPVLYLESYVSKSSGSGSLSDPYIIGTPSGNLSVSLSNSGPTLTAIITKGTGNLNKYCINTSSSITNCTWNNITSTSITYTMPSGGTYYVHVIDDAGYIAHSSLTYVPVPLATTLINSGNLWQSGLEGDGYRFVGSGNATASTSPKNFICFGTTDKDTCTANPRKYMYRIIGVFADENGDNHVKLIKYTQLSTAYAWNADSGTDIDWADSDLYKGLNGSYFLTNTTYSYMQDATWLNKITDWKWSAVNTKSFEDQTNNPYYFKNTGKGIYLHEMNKGTSSDTSCTNYNEAAINCLGGSWTTPTAKIGLMYASDYALSLGQAALSYTSYLNKSTLKTGWMHQSNNDTSADTFEWTISRFGEDSSSHWHAWLVDAAGSVYYTDADNEFGSHAVFYLESNISGSGEGALENPIILD